jgi:hypothetical protein
MKAPHRPHLPHWLLVIAALVAVCVLTWRGLSAGAADPGFLVGVIALILTFPALLRDLRPAASVPPVQAFTRQQYADLQFDHLKSFERDYVTLPLHEWRPSLHAHSLATESQPTYSSIEMVPYNKYVLLGNLGAGKSTLLRWVARRKLRDFRDGKTSILPFWIDLSVEGNPEDPHALIAAWWERHRIADDLEAQLANGGLLLLLDGLNEMPGDRPARAEQMRAFLRMYPGPVIVTCREADYYDAVGNASLRIGDGVRIGEVQIQTLTKENVMLFAQRQLGDQGKVTRFADEVYGARSTPERRALAGNALALTLLLRLFKNPSGTFPKDREQLYDAYIRDVHERNQAEKQGKARVRTGYDTLVSALRQLAYFMLVEGKGASVNRQWADAHVALSRAWWLARIGLMSRHDYELQAQQRTMREKATHVGSVRATRLRKWRMTVEMARVKAQTGTAKRLVERIIARQGRRILRDAICLDLIVEDPSRGNIQFFHQSLYEHLALPLIDFTHGSAKSHLHLIRRLGELGCIARPALSKIVEVYLNETTAPEMSVLGAALKAQTIIAYQSAMSADIRARELAFRLLAACWAERALWVISLTHSEVTTTIARNLAQGLKIALDRSRARTLMYTQAVAHVLALTLAYTRSLLFTNLAFASTQEVDLDSDHFHSLDRSLEAALWRSHMGVLDRAHTLAFMRDLLAAFAPSLSLDVEAAMIDPTAARAEVCALIRQWATELSETELLA